MATGWMIWYGQSDHRDCLSSRANSRPARPQTVEIGDLYDAASEFIDTAERWMYLVDRQLRDTATELLSLSRIVLASLEEK